MQVLACDLFNSISINYFVFQLWKQSNNPPVNHLIIILSVKMTRFIQLLFLLSLITMCAGEQEKNLTAEYDAMNWMELRDAVAKHIPTTTESIVHHYVQKISDKLDGVEHSMKTVVKSEVDNVTDGISGFVYKCLLVAGIVLAFMLCGGTHLCCTIYKTERATQKHMKETGKSSDIAEMCV